MFRDLISKPHDTPQTAEQQFTMPQNEDMERLRKLHGRRLDHEEKSPQKGGSRRS
jgi:hypothetical protein